MLASARRTGHQSRPRRHRGTRTRQTGAPRSPGCVPDSIIEIDNKSITHRPDLWGHFGMAREVAAILGRKLKDPVRARPAARRRRAPSDRRSKTSTCARDTARWCSRTSTVQPSPLWLQSRLTAIGLNPINNIVDMTNFIMAELAQPMHAFDADLLTGDTIFIRPASAGERFRALNDEEYTLDAREPGDRRCRRRHRAGRRDRRHATAPSARRPRAWCWKAPTSRRPPFARPRPPSSCAPTPPCVSKRRRTPPTRCAAWRARHRTAAGNLARHPRWWAAWPTRGRRFPPPPPIELPLDWLERKLGRAIEPAEVRRILESLEFGVSRAGARRVLGDACPPGAPPRTSPSRTTWWKKWAAWWATIPSRPQAPLVPAAVPPANPNAQVPARGARHFRRPGFHGSLQLLVPQRGSALRAFGFDPAAHVRVANPIASDQALMRTSLLPGIWRNVCENAKHRECLPRFSKSAWRFTARAGGPARTRSPHLAAAIYDRYGRWRGGPVRNQARRRVPACPARRPLPAEAAPTSTPRARPHILWKGQTVGRAVRAAPALVESGRAAVLDLDLRAGRRTERGRRQVHAHPPLSLERLRSLGDRRRRASWPATCRPPWPSFAGPLLESIEFVRQYSGPPLAEGPEERLFPRHRRLARAHALLRRSGRDPRPHHRRDARPGLRTARVSTRRAKPGGWVARRTRLCRWCGADVPKGRFTFCGDCVRPRVEAAHRSRRICASRSSRATAGCARSAGWIPKRCAEEKRKLGLPGAPPVRKRMGQPRHCGTPTTSFRWRKAAANATSPTCARSA